MLSGGLLFLALWCSGAQAQDAEIELPIDIELLRPAFSSDAGLGVDSGRFPAPRTLTAGILLQHERNPLRMYEYGDLIGNVVARRTAMHLGVTYTASRRIGVRMVIPMAVHQGSTVPEFSGDGFGMGDASLGVRVNPGAVGPMHFALHADLLLPTGAKSRYMGEKLPRSTIGVAILADLGPVEIMTDLSGHLRGPVPTSEDLTIGSELLWNSGVRFEVVPELMYVNAEVLTRAGFAKFFRGEGENTVEALVGFQTYSSKYLRIDLGVGRGLTEGYGSTALRLMGGVTFQWAPKPKIEVDPTESWAEEDIPEETDPVVVEAPPPKEPEEWKEGQLARIELEQIVIRDPIQFELDTTNILSISMPTLQAVADLMNSNGNIGHLVIEGHASAEGSYEYNYDLSIRRARAIFEQLIKAGVHPNRMSYRGMGEVVPTQGGEDEASLSPNRRVMFHIVRQFAPNESLPNYDTHIRLPWDGTDADVRQPIRPETPPPKNPQGKPEPKVPTEIRLDEDPAPETPPAPNPPAPTETPAVPALEAAPTPPAVPTLPPEAPPVPTPPVAPPAPAEVSPPPAPPTPVEAPPAPPAPVETPAPAPPAPAPPQPVETPPPPVPPAPAPVEPTPAPPAPQENP